MAAGKTSVLHTASTAIIAANQNRKGVYLSPNASNNVWVKFGADAVVGEGLLLKAGSEAVLIANCAEAKKAVNGYAVTGSSDVGYHEIF